MKTMTSNNGMQIFATKLAKSVLNLANILTISAFTCLFEMHLKGKLKCQDGDGLGTFLEEYDKYAPRKDAEKKEKAITFLLRLSYKLTTAVRIIPNALLQIVGIFSATNNGKRIGSFNKYYIFECLLFLFAAESIVERIPHMGTRSTFAKIAKNTGKNILGYIYISIFISFANLCISNISKLITLKLDAKENQQNEKGSKNLAGKLLSFIPSLGSSIIFFCVKRIVTELGLTNIDDPYYTHSKGTMEYGMRIGGTVAKSTFSGLLKPLIVLRNCSNGWARFTSAPIRKYAIAKFLIEMLAESVLFSVFQHFFNQVMKELHKKLTNNPSDNENSYLPQKIKKPLLRLFLLIVSALFMKSDKRIKKIFKAIGEMAAQALVYGDMHFIYAYLKKSLTKIYADPYSQYYEIRYKIKRFENDPSIYAHLVRFFFNLEKGELDQKKLWGWTEWTPNGIHPLSTVERIPTSRVQYSHPLALYYTIVMKYFLHGISLRNSSVYVDGKSILSLLNGQYTIDSQWSRLEGPPFEAIQNNLKISRIFLLNKWKQILETELAPNPTKVYPSSAEDFVQVFDMKLDKIDMKIMNFFCELTCLMNNVGEYSRHYRLSSNTEREAMGSDFYHCPTNYLDASLDTFLTDANNIANNIIIQPNPTTNEIKEMELEASNPELIMAKANKKIEDINSTLGRNIGCQECVLLNAAKLVFEIIKALNEAQNLEKKVQPVQPDQYDIRTGIAAAAVRTAAAQRKAKIANGLSEIARIKNEAINNLQIHQPGGDTDIKTISEQAIEKMKEIATPIIKEIEDIKNKINYNIDHKTEYKLILEIIDDLGQKAQEITSEIGILSEKEKPLPVSEYIDRVLEDTETISSKHLGGAVFDNYCAMGDAIASVKI